MQFQHVVEEVTGHAVPVFQRVDQAGFALPLDERVLADTDTLFVFGLDHMVTEQDAAPEEIEAVRAFLDARRHLPGHRPAPRRRALATTWQSATWSTHHHGDALVPRQQRFGGYTRSLMEGLGIPVENR